MKVQDAVRQILKLGQGCFLAKIDIDSAFCNVLVHPHHRHLLGMIWNQQLYVDTVLPFGLRSPSPPIFNAIAAALHWTAIQRGVSYLDHFLDDFLPAAATGTGMLFQPYFVDRHVPHPQSAALSSQVRRPLNMSSVPGY